MPAMKNKMEITALKNATAVPSIFSYNGWNAMKEQLEQLLLLLLS